MFRKIKDKLKRIHWIKLIFYRTLQIYYKYFFTDKRFIEKHFKKYVGRDVNLENPKEFNDKIQWLKLYWYCPEAIKSADKYEVRKIVTRKIGSGYLNELYGVYEAVGEIDIDKLPTSFVLKSTHSTGEIFICENKYLVNWDKKLKELNGWMKKNIFWNTREWVYKDIKPRIICEKILIGDNDDGSLTDYKFYCFDGKPMYCQVIKNRNTVGTVDFFDDKWKHMEFTGLKQMDNSKIPIQKPEKYDEMLGLSRILSQGYPFVRVDFYYLNNKIYFGELTFFPRSGFGSFSPPEWNLKMGKLIKLPERTS